MAGKRVEVHVTLTNDVSRILNSIKGIQLAGDSDFVTALNIATLTLKHRQNKNQKQRIILFIGSPIKHSVEEMVQTAKKLKKYNIAVDIISFGNVDENRDHIQQFYNNINNANNSSIQEVPVGYNIMDVLFSSPIFNEASGYDMPVENMGTNNNNQNQVPNSGGGMSQFERDMHLAIQQSLEEERKKKDESVKPEKKDDIEITPIEEEDELEAAKRLSMEEHMKVLQKEKDQEDKIKDDLLKDDEFLKQVLEDANLNDQELNDIKNKLNQDKKDQEDKDK